MNDGQKFFRNVDFHEINSLRTGEFDEIHKNNKATHKNLQSQCQHITPFFLKTAVKQTFYEKNNISLFLKLDVEYF
jgi:hypothetical protein